MTPRYRCSFRNVNVVPLMPPVDQISPPTRPVELKPAWFACRTGAGRLGGEATHVPAGQPATFNWSTRFVESKNAPPLASPPIAYSVVPNEARPKSARACVNAGPVDQAPVAMSRRIVAVELTPTVGVKPPTTYR